MRKLFTLSLLFLASTMFAQDVITLKNGKQERAKVEEVGISEIKYHKENNPDGPIYAVAKTDVLKIDYANGDSDVFQTENKSKGWFIQPEINFGALDDISWGGGLSAGYEFNNLISAGIGSQLYCDINEGFSANVYGFAHINFNKSEGHWFGELRTGYDFCWETILIEPMIGYEFKPIKSWKGKIRLSYGFYNLTYEGTGYMINCGYKL